jgi:hypothetical protein
MPDAYRGLGSASATLWNPSFRKEGLREFGVWRVTGLPFMGRAEGLRPSVLSCFPQEWGIKRVERKIQMAQVCKRSP